MPAATNTPQLFVSYTLRDGTLTPEKLRCLEGWLARFGEPYVDILHNYSDRPQDHVMTMLGTSRVLVACITSAFYDSPWVRLELRMAHQYRIPVIRLLVTDETIDALDRHLAWRADDLLGAKRHPALGLHVDGAQADVEQG